MRADGSDQNHWIFGMRERSSGRQVVGRRASWCSDADSVSENSRVVFVVTEQLNLRHGCRLLAFAVLNNGTVE